MRDLRQCGERRVPREVNGGDSPRRAGTRSPLRHERGCPWERAVAQAFRREFCEYVGIDEGRCPSSRPPGVTSKACVSSSGQARRFS